LENLGLLTRIEDVADLYRASDLGLVFMATPHPSYQPLEYMACGCIVATNRNEANHWLLNDENALLLEPLPEVAASRIVALLQNPDQCRDLVQQGFKTIERLDWDTAYDVIERRILGTAEATL